ncbi:hypothetical protein VE02_09605 [Pseudogymnoascus sp. 03VT05]|nr:hypothetical protein VE02_09605 [Pseudogymnoascus sp. 03VT05]
MEAANATVNRDGRIPGTNDRGPRAVVVFGAAVGGAAPAVVIPPAVIINPAITNPPPTTTTTTAAATAVTTAISSLSLPYLSQSLHRAAAVTDSTEE